MSLDFEVMKSYDFYTDLFIPQLRYDPIGTNSVYLNSITSVYKEDSLKLEVITGREDFVAAYTVLAIEFENLKGETTGRIEIPAEEVNSTHLFFTDFVHLNSKLDDLPSVWIKGRRTSGWTRLRTVRDLNFRKYSEICVFSSKTIFDYLYVF